MENPWKKENRFRSNSAQLGRPRPLRLTGESHLSAMAAFAHSLAPLLPLSGGANLSASFPSRARAPPLSTLRARIVNVVDRSPARSLSLAMRWASPVSSVFPTTDADPRPQVRHGDHPRCLPTRTCSLLNPAHTRSLSPTSFRTRSPYQIGRAHV